MNPKIRKISSHFAWTPQGWLRWPILSFDTQGRIVEVGASETLDSQAEVEFFDGLLIPGMVNAHCHSELSYPPQQIAPQGELAGFVDPISQFGQGAQQKDCRSPYPFWSAKMKSEGIIALADTCNSALTFEHQRAGDLYCHNFIEYFGLSATEFSAMDYVANQAAELGLPFSITPHSTYSLQQAHFEHTAGRGNPLSIHFMESPVEQQLSDGYGPLQQCNERFVAHFTSPAQRIVESISAQKRILLVHNTFVTEGDIDLLETHFQGRSTWVLCPCSSQYAEGTLPPIELLRRKGVCIAIGTDSPVSNDSLSMIQELKALKDCPLHQMIAWATLYGAQALGVDHWAGSFEVGKRPGAVLLRGIDWRNFSLTPQARAQSII